MEFMERHEFYEDNAGQYGKTKKFHPAGKIKVVNVVGIGQRKQQQHTKWNIAQDAQILCSIRTDFKKPNQNFWAKHPCGPQNKKSDYGGYQKGGNLKVKSKIGDGAALDLFQDRKQVGKE